MCIIFGRIICEENKMENILKFNGPEFKIMQIADVQENAQVNPDTIKLISLAVKREKPDLVVFTGDQIQGYDSSYKTDAEEKIKNTIKEFIGALDGTPFCFTFGNHDDNAGVSKKKQLEFYENSGNCFVGSMRDSEEDIGTQFLTVKDIDGESDILGLYLIDTWKKQNNASAYSPIKKEQVKWYTDTREENRKSDGSYLDSVVFQHIPFPEFYDVLEKVSPFKKGAVEAFRSRKNTFWALDDETVSKGGFMGESPAVPEINNGEFEAVSEKGDVIGVFVGHDHINSFVKNLKGVDLGYTQGAGFNTYGPGDKRGVRVFVFNREDIRNYQTYTVTMGELCDYKPSKPLQEFIYCNMPTSVDEVVTNVKRAAILSAGVYGAARLAKFIFKK